jgi:hypothetical protein
MHTDSHILLTYGKDCKKSNEPLELKGLQEIFAMIKESSNDLRDFTKSLRSIIKYSKDRYRAMKTGLPFFSCSVFDPPNRGIKNFQYAVGLIIDIDSDCPLDEVLIQKLKSDIRIFMGYISPSQMGIKLLFLFDQPIKDAHLYTAVYKQFSYEFANMYHLADKIDTKNCDVSRISFLCHDPNAWFFHDAIPIDSQGLLLPALEPDDHIENRDLDADLSPEVYKTILQKLDTKPRTPKATIPLHQDIEDVLPDIKLKLEEYQIYIKEVEPIQYGAKIRVYKDKEQGELNIYTGKQGYKVLASPRKGSHAELNEVARYIVEGVLIRF